MADSLEWLYKILACRFNPQESESIMNTEFKCILDRVTSRVVLEQYSDFEAQLFRLGVFSFVQQ